MVKSLSSKQILIGVLTGVILIVIGGTYYLKHLDNERTLEKERNMRLDYQQWHLPEGAKARIGTGTIRAMQYSPDGNLLAVVSDIGVWILDAQTAEPRHLLAAHTGIINSISFSPDGSTLAVGTENGTVQLWDTSTGEHQKTFTRREYRFGVDNVFFMPDGRTLAVIYFSMLDLWDIVTGKRKNTLLAASENDPDANVRYIPNMYMSFGAYRNSFSSDGKTIVSYIDNGTFRFWDIATRKEIRTLKAKPSGQFGQLVSFSSDLQTVAFASYNSYKEQSQIQVWDVNFWSVNTQTQIKTDNFEPPFLVFSPDGNFIASYVNKAIRIWDVYIGKEKKRFKGHKSTVMTVAFSPDNRTLVSSSYDNTLRFWDIDTGKEKKTVAGYGALFRDVSLSADAQTLMSLGPGSNTIRLWNSNTGQHEKNFIGHKKGVWDAVLSLDGSKLASSSFLKNSIYLWDVNTGKLSKLKGPRRLVSGVAFSRDGETLASWGSSGKRKDVIQFYDADTGRIQRTLQLTDQDDFSGSEDLYFDKKMLAGFGKFDLNLFVWDLVAKDYNITSMKFTNEGYVKKVIVARFSPDGRVLAIVFKVPSLQALKTERNIVLRDVETGDHIRTLIGHTDDVESLAFSPDSQTLASGSRDKTIRLWDIETGRSKVVTDPSWADNVRMYAGVASKIAFSPDGQTFASGMKRGDIHLWETATGAKKKTLRGHSQRIAHIFFSADGQMLISVSDDGTMLIWNLTHPL